MVQHLTALAFTAVLVVAAPSAFAQATNPSSSSPVPARMNPVVVAQPASAPDLSDVSPVDRVELEEWMNEFTRWQQWAAEWGNRRQRGWFTSFRDRQEKPAPPDWLPSRCEAVLDESDLLTPACALLAQWRQDYMTGQVQVARVAVAAQSEDTQKTTWWEHVHVDALWPSMQQTNVFGVVGMHTTATVRGRWQVFLAPGAMVLTVPTVNGGRAWKVATNYGVGYRLADFTFLGRREAKLHVNLAKAWILSDMSDTVMRRSMDFVGLSITFTRER